MSDRIAFYAGQPHYWHHLAPVYLSLPEHLRGPVRAQGSALAAARSYGLPAKAGLADLPEMVVVAGGHDAHLLQGRHRVAHLDHGAGQTYGGDPSHPVAHRSYAGGPDLERVELWLCASERVASVWRSAYPRSAAVAVGPTSVQPDLPAPGTGVAAITFHWPCDLVAEAGTAFHDWSDRLPEMAQRCEMIGHAHPRWGTRLRKTYEAAGIEWVADWREVIARADLLIADNTSAIYEWAALRRPVVLLNAARWRPEVEHGLRFWSAIPGPSLWPADGETLLELLGDMRATTALWFWHELAQQAVHAAYGDLADGRAAERAAQALIDWRRS